MLNDEKIEVQLVPPYSMDNYVEPLFRGLKCSLMANIQNCLLDKNSMYVREGLERQSASSLGSGSVLALHRAIYVSGSSRLFSAINSALMYYTVDGPTYSGGLWSALSLPGNVSLNPGQRGEFRTFKNKTYYSNSTEPVLMIRDASPPTVHEAGLASPNLKKDIDLCDDASDWTSTPAGYVEDDYGIARYTQGDRGIAFREETAGQTTYITRVLDSTLSLTTFEDGSDSTTEDYIAFTAFRFWKQSISQLQISLSSNSTDFTDNFSCNVYIEPTGGIASWDYFSPRQQSMSAMWANDPDDFKLFDIKLRKKWFTKTGSPDWSDIRAVRFTIVGDNGATSSRPAKVTIDNVRLLKSPPVAAPYRLQLAEFERDETWANVSGSAEWVEYWATTGVSAIYLPAGCSIRMTVSKDISEYADGVSVSDNDVIQLDVGGEGSITSTVQVDINDGTNTATWYLGVLAHLAGAGVTRQKKLGNLSNWSSLNKSSVAYIQITNNSAAGVYVDNLRIAKAQPKKIIDPFKPADRIAIDALGEWLEPYLRDHPLAALVTSAASEWYKQYWYTTSGEGYLKYPDYSRGEFGFASMTMGALAGSTFGVRIKRKVNLDLTEYSVWSASSSFTPRTRENYEAGNWGWLTKEEIDVDPEDEFRIWLSARNWAAIKSITFRFFWDSGVGADKLQADSSITDSDYWEYTMDYTVIQEMIRKYQYIVSLQKKMKNSHPDSVEEIYSKMYLQDVGTNINTDNLTYLGLQGTTPFGPIRTSPISIGEDPDSVANSWYCLELRWRIKDLMAHTTSETANLQNIGGYEILLTAGGEGAEVSFDRWELQKRGALDGRYYYRTVFEDEEGYFSAPSDISRPIDCDKSDAIVTNIVTPNDVRVRNKVILRLGGKHPDLWMKVRDLEPETTYFTDDVSDDDAVPFEEEFYYAPPKAKVMEPIGNYMWYLNITDRFNRRKPSRGYRSRPFAPFQVSDYDVFEIRPEDGEEITGCKEADGLLVIPKEHSIFTLSPDLDDRARIRCEDFGIIAPRSFVVSSYGIFGLSHKGVIRGDINRWDGNFGKGISGALDGISTSALADAVGFVRDDHYFIFFGSSTNTIGFACYLPTGQWSRLSGIECQTVQLLEASGEGNKVLYGDSGGYVNYMFSGDTDFGNNISSLIESMHFITSSIDRSQILRRVSMLVKRLAVGTGGGASGATIGTDVIGTAVIGGGSGGSGTDPTTIVTPYEDQSAVTALSSQDVDEDVFNLIRQDFPQGIEGYTLGIKITGTGRYSLSDIMLEIWQRPPWR